MSSSRSVPSRVVVGCFRGLPEHTFVVRAAAAFGAVSRTDDRAAIVALAERLQPRLILLPTVDEDGHAVAPLVARCRAVAPRAAIVMVIVGSPERGRSILRAINSGASVSASRSCDELRVALRQLLQPKPLSHDFERQIRTLCAGIGSDVLAEALVIATRDANQALRVRDLAHRLVMSTRTLTRRLASVSAPAPADIIVWGRLLRAANIGNEGDAIRAQDIGFRDNRAFARAVRRLAGTLVCCSRGASRIAVDRAAVLEALRMQLIGARPAGHPDDTNTAVTLDAPKSPSSESGGGLHRDAGEPATGRRLRLLN